MLEKMSDKGRKRQREKGRERERERDAHNKTELTLRLSVFDFVVKMQHSYNLRIKT